MSNSLNYIFSFLKMPDVRILHHGKKLIGSGWNFKHRKQPFWILYWNETPGAEVIFGNRSVKLTPDIILLIPPYTTFSTKLHQPFHHFFLQFTAESPFDHVKHREIILPAEPFAGRLRESFEKPVLDAMRKYEIIFDVLLHLPEDCFSARKEYDIDPRILQALDIMMYEETMSNEDICQQIGMSVSNFQRIFKEEMKLSPKRYAMNLRLEKARHLLINTGIGIEEIALETGFADRYHFSKAFKSFFQVSPAEYRKLS